MFKRVMVLTGIAVLALALAACAGGDDYGGDAYGVAADPDGLPRSTPAPAPTAAGPAGPAGAPGAPVPVQWQLTTAQEGFNSIGGSSTVNDAAYDLTFFKHHGVNPFIDTEDDHLSTFAIDVDTAVVHSGPKVPVRREYAPPRFGPGRGIHQLLLPRV